MDLIISLIDDPYVRENFRRLDQELGKASPLSNFQHYELTVNGPTSRALVRHNLKTRPLDIVQTHLSGIGSVTWHYESFTKDYLVYSSTGPCRVRMYLGTQTGSIKIGVTL